MTEEVEEGMEEDDCGGVLTALCFILLSFSLSFPSEPIRFLPSPSISFCDG
jgi:hypothetical protein